MIRRQALYAGPSKGPKIMIALIKHIAEQIVDAAKFTVAVWHDARSLQAETEAKYGPLGF